jgi:hypothetical protein
MAAHIHSMDTGRAGWIVVARAGDTERSPKRFVVHISNVDEAVMLIAKLLPKSACSPERMLSPKDVRNFNLRPGAYKQLMTPKRPDGA